MSEKEEVPQGQDHQGAWQPEDIGQAIAAEHGEELAARAMELHRQLEAAGARVLMGAGKVPYANYRLADGTATPVSLSLSPAGLQVNFEFVRRDRSEDDLWRLLDLTDSIPGAKPHLEIIHRLGWCQRPILPLEDILTDDRSAEQIVAAAVAASLGSG